ncbi:MAG: serine hydrolase domain-containing protein [Pseudomonadota bacterium]
MTTIRRILSAMALSASVFSVALPLPAHATGPHHGANQAPSTPLPGRAIAQIDQAWSSWTRNHNVRASAIAVGYDGELVYSAGRRRDPATPYPVASLSKAITAVCTEAVLAEIGHTFDVTLGDLAEYLAPHLAIPSHVRNLRVSDLIAQRSGLATDPTQVAFDRHLYDRAPQHRIHAAQAIAPTRAKGTRGAYAYNNANYAVLGTLIEAVSGQTYADACQARVLDPSGVRSGHLSRDWQALSGAAGWALSAEDYLRFAMAAFSPRTTRGARPFALPNASIGDGAYYGMGLVFRKEAQGTTFWHNGKLCVNRAGHDAGAYLIKRGPWTIVVNYAFCPRRGEDWALDRALWPIIAR